MTNQKLSQAEKAMQICKMKKEFAVRYEKGVNLLKDWQMWEDCILSFFRTYPKVREDFNKHVEEWNTHTPLPPSAYERE